MSRTAETAGLTAERMRQAGDRMRGQGPMPLPHRSRRWLRAALIVGAIIAVIAGALFAARQVYFLGTDEGGRVAVYRGLPYDLPLGIELYSEQESIGVQAADLSAERQGVVTEHKLRSEDDARDILEDIEAREGAETAAPAPAKTQAKGKAKNGANSADGAAGNQGAAGAQTQP